MAGWRHVLDMQVRHRADVDQRRWVHRLPVIDLRHGRPSAAVHYGPARFVATGLTKHLAVEWARRGIRVSAVAPGTINTERVQRLPEEPGGLEYLETTKAAHPMGRLGEPSEVAEAILFLASDKASFITGAILPVDGGFLAQ
jgi:NAD(P)-dependent dehydrogenase (short-subunit alcohol dehydrogenase family)